MFDTAKTGKKIAELRKQKDMTQFELADAMGISYQAVSNWERGNSMPDISKLAELSDILGTTVDELLGKKNPAVERMIKGDKTDAEEAAPEDMAEAAAIAKPSQLEEMVEKGEVKDATKLLPFLSPAYVAKMADDYDKDGKSVEPFLPFMDE